MLVMRAAVLVPARFPVATISSARWMASASCFRKAPEPVFTSSTNASRPAASFLLMMDAQIRNGLSTVAGAVAQRVERAVRRHQPFRLAHDRETAGAQDGEDLLLLQVGSVAGDALQLVEGAAGVAQGAAGDHGHVEPGCGSDGGHQEGGFVAHSTGGVLIHLGPGQAAEVQDPA